MIKTFFHEKIISRMKPLNETKMLCLPNEFYHNLHQLMSIEST